MSRCRRCAKGKVRPETLITFSANAEAQDPSKMGFKAGTQLTLENALRMLMVKSANDVAVAIAEGLGGSVEGFADEMNARARRLGMTGSHFVNPHGLPNPEQYTTARDMAVLARALIRDFPEAEALFRIPAIKLGKIRMRNHNGLLHSYQGVDGMKTGFICAAGFNVVATATRGGKRLIAVVFGGSLGQRPQRDRRRAVREGASSPASISSPDARRASISSTMPAVRPATCATWCAARARSARPRPTTTSPRRPPGASSADPDGIYAAVRGDRPAAHRTARRRCGAAEPARPGGHRRRDSGLSRTGARRHHPCRHCAWRRRCRPADRGAAADHTRAAPLLPPEWPAGAAFVPIAARSAGSRAPTPTPRPPHSAERQFRFPGRGRGTE